MSSAKIILLRRFVASPKTLTARSFHCSAFQAAMKPGTPIPGLNIRKDQDPPVALKREEYPEWVDTLAEPQISLAKLRRMPEEEATDREKMRYLKLTRRQKIRQKNEESG